ncbi:MAG: DUF4411 family protein [Acidimicrobiaceae bacterium]|nr:DUF4411 family protein [Acidimicrobiaceae bacterium]MCY4279163.1 DUF4411 family protein [Acidimicrobiaceae bacterium]
MTSKEFYLVDSDVFITAKNFYYSFEICPGFWKCLLHHHQQGSVFSIDRVRSELRAGASEDALVDWVNSSVPDTFFLKVDTEAVTNAYREIILWVRQHPICIAVVPDRRDRHGPHYRDSRTSRWPQ